MNLPDTKRFPFLRASAYGPKYQWWLIALWPLIAIALIGSGAYSLDRDDAASRAAVDAVARKEASALASAYALQLSHTVEQLDQSLSNLKYFWENAPQAVSLVQLAKQGMYPPEKNVYIAIYDAHGTLTDSTLPVAGTVNIAAESLFETHGTSPKAGLLITKHDSAPGVPRATVWFSRRLEKANGDFAGVIAIAVEPRYLGSFYDRTALGRGDFVTVRSTTGKVLSTKMGEQIRSYTGIFRKPPVFREPRGVELYPATSFNDNEARLYAWDTLEKYPLISTVGLLESDIHAELVSDIRAKRRAALAIAFAIGLIALTGMLLNLIWLRRRHQAQVSRNRYLIAIESGNEGFFSLYPVMDGSGKSIDFVIAECNERGATMLGNKKSEMTGKAISGFCSAREFPLLLEKFLLAMERGSYEDEFVQVDDSGTSRVLYRHLIRSAHGIALTLRDVSETRQHEAQLHAMANRDALTHAFNRHWFMTNLPLAMERASAQNKPLALLFIDLDNFKEINNTYGHGAGDSLLVMTCERFRELIRPQDHVVRLGGDEFTIILEQAGRAEIVDIADRIIDGLSRPFFIENVPVDLVRASIGISIFPEDGATVDTLVKHADDAMYAAKRAGKAHYRFYRTRHDD